MTNLSLHEKLAGLHSRNCSFDAGPRRRGMRTWLLSHFCTVKRGLAHTVCALVLFAYKPSMNIILRGWRTWVFTTNCPVPILARVVPLILVIDGVDGVLDSECRDDSGDASGTVNQAVVPPYSLRSIPATPPRKAVLVATEETIRTTLRGGQKHVVASEIDLYTTLPSPILYGVWHK